MGDMPPISNVRPLGGRVPPVGSRRPTGSIPPTTERLRRKIAENLTGYTVAGAIALNTAGDTWSAEVWDQLGGKWAESVADVAMINSRLRRILDRSIDGGTYGTLIVSTMCMAAPVIAQWVPGIPEHIQQRLGLLPVSLRRIDAAEYMETLNRMQEAAAAAAAGNSQRVSA